MLLKIDTGLAALGLALCPLVLGAVEPAPSPAPDTPVTSPFVRERLAEPLGWQPFGLAAYERARRDGKPLLLLLGRLASVECGAGLRAVLASSDLAQVLARGFVLVAADVDERPDLRDVLDTAALVLERIDESANSGGAARPASGSTVTWAVLTSAGWPVAVGSLDATSRDGRVAERLARRLEALAARMTTAPAEVTTEAGLALARLRAAQVSETATGALERAVVRRARDGLAQVFEPSSGRFGTGTHGALRLLLAQTSGDDQATRGLLERALDALARQPLPACQPTLPELALRLRAHATAFARFGRPTDRAAAERAATALLALRSASGAFVAGPGDERVLAGANALALGALARSSQALGRAADLNAAQAAATDVGSRLGPAQDLRRVARGSERGGPALLEDYAYLIEGLLDLHDAAREHSGDARRLHEALALAEVAERRFADPAGGFFDTDGAHEPLPVRPRSAYDGAMPNPNGVLAAALVRLASATGDARQADFARFTVMGFLGELTKGPGGLATLAAAAGDVLDRASTEPGVTPAGAERLDNRASPTGTAREVRGGLTLSLTLAPERVRAGTRCEARIGLQVAPGFSVNAHRTSVRGLTGLSVALLTDWLRAAAPHYPVPREIRRGLERDLLPAYLGAHEVILPLTIPTDASPGPSSLRVRVGFQVCDARACQAPDSVVLTVPVQVVAP